MVPDSVQAVSIECLVANPKYTSEYCCRTKTGTALVKMYCNCALVSYNWPPWNVKMRKWNVNKQNPRKSDDQKRPFVTHLSSHSSHKQFIFRFCWLTRFRKREKIVARFATNYDEYQIEWKSSDLIGNHHRHHQHSTSNICISSWFCAARGNNKFNRIEHRLLDSERLRNKHVIFINRIKCKTKFFIAFSLMSFHRFDASSTTALDQAVHCFLFLTRFFLLFLVFSTHSPNRTN